MNDRLPHDAASAGDALDEDLLLRQVRAVLTPLPEVDRRAIGEIMTKVAARERVPRSRIAVWWEAAGEWWQFGVPPLARGSALVATALVVGFVARGAWPGSTSTAAPTRAVAPAAVTATGADVRDDVATALRTPLVSTDGAERTALPVPVQFVLDGRELPEHATVSVVGDFNDWDVQAAPMSKDGGVWSTTLAVLPGRHVYAFVVNGEKWMADPRAAKAPDADFGRPGSVIIVQTP